MQAHVTDYAPDSLDNKCFNSWKPIQAFLSYMPVAALA